MPGSLCGHGESVCDDCRREKLLILGSYRNAGTQGGWRASQGDLMRLAEDRAIRFLKSRQVPGSVLQTFSRAFLWRPSKQLHPLTSLQDASILSDKLLEQCYVPDLHLTTLLNVNLILPSAPLTPWIFLLIQCTFKKTFPRKISASSVLYQKCDDLR